jgi:hypothetical protein
MLRHENTVNVAKKFVSVRFSRKHSFLSWQVYVFARNFTIARLLKPRV